MYYTVGPCRFRAAPGHSANLDRFRDLYQVIAEWRCGALLDWLPCLYEVDKRRKPV